MLVKHLGFIALATSVTFSANNNFAVAAASNSHLRGPGVELKDSLTIIERQLKSDNGNGCANGGSNGRPCTTTTTTTTTEAAVITATTNPKKPICSLGSVCNVQGTICTSDNTISCCGNTYPELTCQCECDGDQCSNTCFAYSCEAC